MPCTLSIPDFPECPKQLRIEVVVNHKPVRVEFINIEFITAGEFEKHKPAFKKFTIGCSYYQFFDIWRASGFESNHMNMWLIDDAIDGIRLMFGMINETEFHIRNFLRMKSISNFFMDKKVTGISITMPRVSSEIMIPDSFVVDDGLWPPPNICGMNISGIIKQIT